MTVTGNAEARRHRSKKLLAGIGLMEPPPHLPLVDGTVVRDLDAVVRRIACLSAVAAVAHGCPTEVAQEWLRQEQVTDALAPSEVSFLAQPRRDGEETWRPEAIYALGWAVGLVKQADYLTAPVPEDLVLRVPHPPPSPQSLAGLTLKPVQSDAVVDALDVAFCAHWALVESRLRNQSVSHLAEPVVVERRRAWEWLIEGDEWDDVRLDT